MRNKKMFCTILSHNHKFKSSNKFKFSQRMTWLGDEVVGDFLEKIGPLQPLRQFIPNTYEYLFDFIALYKEKIQILIQLNSISCRWGNATTHFVTIVFSIWLPFYKLFLTPNIQITNFYLWQIIKLFSVKLYLSA